MRHLSFVIVALMILVTDAKRNILARAAQDMEASLLCDAGVLACHFCIDLNCSWTPSVGCSSVCNSHDCVQGSDKNSTQVCASLSENKNNRTITRKNDESPSCNGLTCEDCMGVQSCSWSNQEGCVLSCSDTVDCFPSDTYTAIDVCTSGVVDDACDGLVCQECLTNECDWAPELGCLANCSIFDMGCFPGEVFDAIDVCHDEPDNGDAAAEPTTPTSSARTWILSSSNVIFYICITVLMGIGWMVNP